MQYIGFDKKFGLLGQESFLAKNTILSGFDLLLNANFFQAKEGYFYSAFFHLSIGIERILKLAVITHHMLDNNYTTPTIKQLKFNFGHDIKAAYEECEKLSPIYRPNATSHKFNLEPIDIEILDFLAEYGMKSRYFNIDEVCEAKNDKSPLEKWHKIADKLYDKNTPGGIKEKAALNLMYKMDSMGSSNSFTINLGFDGHPMTEFDIYYLQYVTEKSAPLAIWRMIEILRPIYFLLDGMSDKAADYENTNNIKAMTIPRYEEFFYFLLAMKPDIKRRKQWSKIFHG